MAQQQSSNDILEKMRLSQYFKLGEWVNTPDAKGKTVLGQVRSFRDSEAGNKAKVMEVRIHPDFQPAYSRQISSINSASHLTPVWRARLGDIVKMSAEVYVSDFGIDRLEPLPQLSNLNADTGAHEVSAQLVKHRSRQSAHEAARQKDADTPKTMTITDSYALVVGRFEPEDDEDQHKIAMLLLDGTLIGITEKTPAALEATGISLFCQPEGGQAFGFTREHILAAARKLQVEAGFQPSSPL